MAAGARRTLAVASLGALALTGCQSDGGTSASTTSAASSTADRGCSGGKAPAFTGSATAYDAPAPVEDDGAVAVQVSSPELTERSTRQDGYRIARVHLGARVRTNGVFAITPGSIVLADADGHVCERPTPDPLPDAFAAMKVDESHPDAGDVAFLVPDGADLSTYSVMYVDSPRDEKASAKWSADGKARTLPVEDSCAGEKSTYSTKKAEHHTFGHGETFGDDTVSLKVTAYTPDRISLKPSRKQPNDVEGIEVKVRGSAEGALGFMGRSQFKLVDGSGHLCRYNPLGSTGETLSSALIKPGESEKFTLIFWMPKGAKIDDWTLLYFSDPKSKKVSAYWTLPESKTSDHSTSSTSSK